MQEVFVDNYAFSPMLCVMGRPKLPPDQRRTEVFSVRLTLKELAQIDAAAKRAQLDPHDWARMHLLSESK
jgi:hypothetical protein